MVKQGGSSNNVDSALGTENSTTSALKNDPHSQPPGEQIAGGILHPISLENFFSAYWGVKPLHIARSESNPFSALVAETDIEQILSSRRLFFPNVQLTKRDTQIASVDYTDENDEIVAGRVVDFFNQGATLVLSHAQRLHAPLMNLCRQIQASFCMASQTNLYLSPPGQQGFKPHYDTHDVFVLQVSGSKTFHFFNSRVENPTGKHRFDHSTFNVAEKTEQIKLTAGDTLYIPRGMVHDAVADDQQSSLHITLGVYPVLLNDLVMQCLEDAIDHDARLRSAVLARHFDGPALLQQVRSVVNDNINLENVENAFNHLLDSMALDQTEDVQGLLNAVPLSAQLEHASLLKVNAEQILSIDRQGDLLKIRMNGRVNEFTGAVAAAVNWLLSHGSGRVSALPGLDTTQQLALSRQLLQLKMVTHQQGVSGITNAEDV